MLYLRFPNAFRQPNFYAEEGSIFGKNLLNNGFWHAIGTSFNGYYIWGMYLLEKIAFTINSLFYGGQFVNLPRSFALVSYGFFGFIATLPWLLFRNRFRLPALIFATLLIIYVPLGGWDYNVIGILGNTKFAVVFIAFLLLIYRHYLPANAKRVYLVDVSLLICAYTNVTVYVLLPFALLRYWPELYNKKIFSNLKQLVLRDRTAQSLVVLGLALLPQLYFVKRDGVPPQPGYLDTPFQKRSGIEIFLARSYLYELLFTVYKWLGDLKVLVIFAALLGLMAAYGRRYQKIIIFGLLTIFITTLLFVINRPGISSFYVHYTDAGPSQFFYTQNWIFGFLISLLLVEIVSKLKLPVARYAIYGLLVLGFLVVLVPKTGSFGASDFMEKGVGNIYSVAKIACQQPDQQLTITIYPTKAQHYESISRQKLCTPAAVNYVPHDVNFGLAPFNNHYLEGLGSKNQFTQSFISPYNNLDGINLYFSTFTKKAHSPYNLTLYGSDCKTVVSKTAINTSKIRDNSYYTITFPVVADSDHKAYCFSVTAAGQPADPLAVQLSQDNVYLDGQTTINSVPSSQDIVFGLHYR